MPISLLLASDLSFQIQLAHFANFAGKQDLFAR